MKATVTLLVLLAAWPMVAQDAPKPPATDKSGTTQENKETVELFLSPPDPATVAAAPAGGTLTLVSDAKKTSLIGRLGYLGAGWNVGLSLEIPVKKPDEDEATLADPDGLSGDTMATFNLSAVISSYKAPLHPLAPCDDFNEAVGKEFRSSHHLPQGTSAKLLPECTAPGEPDAASPWRKPWEAAKKRALQAACDELVKVELVAPWVGVNLVGGPTVTDDGTRPAYLLSTCGDIERIEDLTKDFRPRRDGRESAKTAEKTAREADLKVLEDKPAEGRMPGDWLAIRSLRQDVERLKAQIASPVVEDPRSWVAAKEPELLKKECQAVLTIPPDGLIDTTNQGDSNKGCEVPVLLKALEASKLSTRERHMLAIGAQRMLLPSVWLVSGTTSAGHQSFKFRESGTLKKLEERKFNTAFSLSLIRASGIDAWTIGHSWRDVYKGGDKVLLCEPIEGTPSESCSETVLTAPERDEKDRTLAFLEYRRFVSTALAYAVRGYYRKDLDQWGLRTTLFFLKKQPGDLDGGIDLGWEKEITILAAGKEKEVGGFVARLFVGRRFKLSDS